MNLWKSLDKSLKTAPARTIEFYNNMISGIIGGGIIYFLTSLKNIQNNLPNQIIAWSWKIFFVIILIILGVKVIENLLKETNLSKKKHLRNYFWNLLAALIGGFGILGIFYWNKIISIALIIILFLLVMFFRNKYLKM